MRLDDRTHFDWHIAQEVPHLRRYAHALVRDAAIADDLVQDCLERAIRKWRLWGRKDRLRGWLFRMLYRVELNRRRSRTNKAEVALGERHGEPHCEAMQLEHVACRDAMQALNALPSLQRDALSLVALQDLSYEEAADVLRVPVGTLRSRLSRGRDMLREIWDA